MRRVSDIIVSGKQGERGCLDFQARIAVKKEFECTILYKVWFLMVKFPLMLHSNLELLSWRLLQFPLFSWVKRILASQTEEEREEGEEIKEAKRSDIKTFNQTRSE